ncbi:MAG: TusE/DsrC/DsvC family sulfur relay protein [Desulfofustis sp.]|nr:TusE/DsrC/DsvC family sulfur relay protein [Desulfofustis sp.]
MEACFNPEIRREVRLTDKTYLVNDRYYLIDFSAWDEQLRDWLAEKTDLELQPEHLAVIDFLRESYRQNKRHPVIRTVTSDLARRYATEKGTVKYFHTLFPGGIHQAYLLAGLPMQDSCC